MNMNLDEITLEDCIEKYEKEGKTVVIEDGRLKGFEDIE